nr:unnamed protein product [Callosobruchus chinensis]
MTAQKVTKNVRKSGMESANAEVSAEKNFPKTGDALAKIGTDHSFKRDIIWSLVVFYGTMHLLGWYGLYRTLFHALRLTLIYSIMVGVASQIGINMGAHRLYAHKAFKAKLPLRIALVMLDTIAGMVIIFISFIPYSYFHKKVFFTKL